MCRPPDERRVDGSERVETMPYLGLIEGTETSIAPLAYVISARRWRLRHRSRPGAPQAARRKVFLGHAPGAPGGRGRWAVHSAGDGNPTTRVIASVVDRLGAHGITYFKTSKEMPFRGERFRIATSESPRRSTREPQAPDTDRRVGKPASRPSRPARWWSRWTNARTPGVHPVRSRSDDGLMPGTSSTRCWPPRRHRSSTRFFGRWRQLAGSGWGSPGQPLISTCRANLVSGADRTKTILGFGQS